MTSRPTALHLSPHPDDEVLGCGATLLALKADGWRVVNLAWTLGRRVEEQARRRAELAASLAVLGIESVSVPASASVSASFSLVGAVDSLAPDLIIAPDPGDAHPTHAALGRAAFEAKGDRPLWTWSLWRDLAAPNLYVPYDEATMGVLQRALACHAGELARNDYADLLRARGRANAILGAERVFGFGARRSFEHPFADLLTAHKPLLSISSAWYHLQHPPNSMRISRKEV